MVASGRMQARMLIAMVADVAPGSVERFRSYEQLVLPLLARHGGRLERRVRSTDGTTEIHLVAFHSEAGYRAYIDDPDRVAARAALDGAEVDQRVLVVSDVP
jgi:uncharacterized protein (DUF1330 family)